MTIILDRSSDYMDQLWVEKYGWVLYMIGFILLVIPYFIFKKYKKNMDCKESDMQAIL